MPNPKRRHSKARTAKRRTHDALKPASLGECPQCHEAEGAAPGLPALRLLPRPPGPRGQGSVASGPAMRAHRRRRDGRRPRPARGRGRGGSPPRGMLDVGVTLVGDSAELSRRAGAPSQTLPARHPRRRRRRRRGHGRAAGRRRSGASPSASIRVAADLVARGERRRAVQRGQHRRDGARGARGVRAAARASTARRWRPPCRPGAGAAVLLDVGANADCRPPHLVQFAAMGAVFARVGARHRAAAVGLLSIGEEETKGNELDARGAPAAEGESPLRFIGQRRGARRLLRRGRRDRLRRVHRQRRAQGQRGPRRRWWRPCCGEEFAAIGRRRAPGWPRRRSGASGGGWTTRSTAARRCSAWPGRCVVGHGRSSAKAVRNAIADGGTGSPREGLVRARRAGDLRLQGASHRDCIHLSGAGIAGGRDGQGARRRVSRRAARRSPRPTRRWASA